MSTLNLLLTVVVALGEIYGETDVGALLQHSSIEVDNVVRQFRYWSHLFVAFYVVFHWLNVYFYTFWLPHLSWKMFEYRRADILEQFLLRVKLLNGWLSCCYLLCRRRWQRLFRLSHVLYPLMVFPLYGLICSDIIMVDLILELSWR